MTFTQVATYEKPTAYNASDGIVGLVNTNILAIEFQGAGILAGKLKAYDDETMAGADKEILKATGVMGANNSWFRAGITSENVLPAAGAGSIPTLGGKLFSTTLGAGNGQLISTVEFQLQGGARYQSVGAVDAGKQVRFMLALFIPSDCSEGDFGKDPSVIMEYTYSGSAPTVKFFYNTGTEGTPIWTELVSGKLHFATGPNTTTSWLEPVIRPVSGVAFPDRWYFET